MHRACRRTQLVSTPAVPPSAMNPLCPTQRSLGRNTPKSSPPAESYCAPGVTAHWGCHGQAPHHCRYVVVALSPPPWLLHRNSAVTLAPAA